MKKLIHTLLISTMMLVFGCSLAGDRRTATTAADTNQMLSLDDFEALGSLIEMADIMDDHTLLHTAEQSL